MIRNRYIIASLAALLALPALPNSSALLAATTVPVDDSFADEDRTKTGTPDALDTNWWSSNSTSGSTVEIDANGLGLVSGNSGRGLHGTFTPQTLAIGGSVTATLTFTTPATVGTDKSGALKIALMDYNDAGLAADLSSTSSSSNPLYENLPGYMVEFDVNKADDSDDIGIRKHNVNTTGRFLATTSEWTALGNGDDVGYGFAANTEYVVVVRVTRTGADTADVFSSLSQGATLLDSYTETDGSGIANNFGMLGVWANSNAFGSTNSAGLNADNGITFSNIKIEVEDGAISTPVSDNFADEDRTKTGTPDALDTNWWSSSSTSGNSVEIDANGLGLVSGNSGRGLHGTFTPQTLDIGGSVTATLTFTTPATVGADDNGLKFALMDLNNAGLAADLSSTSSSSNPLYENLPGYMVQFDVNDVVNDTNIRKHLTPNTSGRFLGTSSSSEWTNMGSSGDDAYSFLANTEYVVVLKVTRKGVDTADVFSSLSKGDTLLTSHTESDASGIANNFGMLGAWANAGEFGSTNGSDPDNGITFTNITIEAVGTVVSNQAPAFSSDSITGANATQDTAYSGSIASDASDLEGDSLTFSKVSGPDWLTVASNGDLGGTPDSSDLGANTFTVQVADAGGSDTATLNITVDAPFAGGTIVDDNFADEDRTKTGTPDALDTNWWGSSGSSAIEIDANGLGLRSGTSGRGIHATFSPQTLNVGDSMTATLTFSTPATVGTGRSTAFKFGLMDLDDPLLASDVGSSKPLWTGVPGYMIDFDVNTGTSANVSVREHDLTDTAGKFLISSGEWDLISGSSSIGYTFDASASYVVVIKATRTNTDSMDIFATLSLASGGGPIASHTASDVDGTIANNFGLLGVAASSNTFGSTASAGLDVDNGITFTNVTVETALDVSDNTPPIASDNSGSIDEDASIGDDVLTVSATDDSAISSYEIIAGNTGDAFSIDSTGLIEVASALDFATTPSYTLTVQVTDDGTPGLKDTATVTIAVNEVVSGFGSWASGFSLVSSIETGDDDNDGIENVLEYILGGDPTAADLSIIPNGATNGANYELTFTRSDDSETDATTTVQFGSDLTAFPATTETVPAASGTVGSVTFTIVENGEGDDSVTASIPHGGATEFFGRVAGSLNP